MSLPNQLIVSGAGTAAANGTYTLSNNEGIPNLLYRNDATNSIGFYYEDNRIGIINLNNGSYFYREAIGSTSSLETSPVGLVYQIGSLGTAPAPTVEEFSEPVPLSPVEERDAKYATESEDGEKRFRRLFGLGYV